MFETLRQSLKTGVVTSSYPKTPVEISSHARGKPEIDWANWKDARIGASVCPTAAIACEDRDGKRTATLDLGKCIFCGLCAEADATIRMTSACELSSCSRDELKNVARYKLASDGTQQSLIEMSGAVAMPIEPSSDSFETTGRELKRRVAHVFGRSLHIRQVDAGSCNGCEMEIQGLNNPIYDIERFGIHFVASPRHADMLLVTGPVTRNMELALRKTYDAMPAPRLVVAVGACGCSGGIFGVNYASLGGVDRILPVDVYIPGCPPNPHALLHGILVATGRMTAITIRNK
jgi:Ni,Fe-hydrogenase III small subunit/formate hydrogenlyase subunit 6/NADH:ubiquinone oxidoreductase subunit I